MRLTLCFLGLSASLCWAAAFPAARSVLTNLPVTFERNQGQWPSKVEFGAHVGGHQYTFGDRDILVDGSIHLDLISSTNGKIEPLEPVVTKSNYLAGGDSHKWITGVPNYARIRRRNAFPGIDLIFYGSDGRLEFDYVVAPGASPASIRLRVRGASLELASGNLRIASPAGRVLEIRAPSAYQDAPAGRQAIDSRFRVNQDGEISIATGPFDHSRPLRIDPILTDLQSAILAVPGFGDAIVSDPEGNFYLAGTTLENIIPTTPGVLRTASPCRFLPSSTTCWDAWVMKFSSTTNKIIWATYFPGVFTYIPGGNNRLTSISAIGLDSSGNVVVCGGSADINFPVTPDAYLSTVPPGTQAPGFLSKLNPTGTALVYSTHLRQVPTLMKIDSRGAVYFSDRLSVEKLTADGSAVPYSVQILGGVNSIAVDDSGNLYALCSTSPNFSVTPGAYKSSDNDPTSISKFDPNGNLLFTASLNAGSYAVFNAGVYESLLPSDIAVDPSGNIVFTGVAATGFPVFNDPDPQPNACLSADPCMAYVAALDSTGSNLLYARLLGPGSGQGLAFDPNGDVFVVGEYESVGQLVGQAYMGAAAGTYFPRTFDAFQYCSPSASAGDFNYDSPGLGGGFIMHLDSQGRRAFSSFFPRGGPFSFSYLRLASDGHLYFGGPGAGYVVGIIDTNQSPRIPHACLVNATQNISDSSGITPNFTTYVAPGQMVTLFGEGLGPQAPADAQWNADGSLSNSLAGVQVLFDGVPAPILYAQANQVNCIVPFEIASQQTTSVVVQYAGAKTDPLVFHVTQQVLDLITKDHYPGSDVIAINQDGTMNSADHPAPRGSIITLFATGLGQTNPPLHDGEIAKAAAPTSAAFNLQFFYPTAVSPARVNADILYQGAAPGEVAGVYQLNVRVPENALTGHTFVVLSARLGPIQSSIDTFATESIWLQ